MTESETVRDPVGEFTAALSAAAHRHLDLNWRTRAAIQTACERVNPEELARIVGFGITRSTVNAAGVMTFRLLRESGLLEEEQN